MSSTIPRSGLLRIAIVGCGFMGRTHANAWRQAPAFFDLQHKPVLQAACARNKHSATEFAKTWDCASVETDWRELIARDDIDIIDIASPNNTHYEISLAAAAAGKAVLCEKPLGRTLDESVAMTEAVEQAGVPNMVWYNYRRVPAVTLARQLIDDGKLGRVFHYRANFLQDWIMSEDLPQGGEALWRLDESVAGSGVAGDLLAHCIKITRDAWRLVGESVGVPVIEIEIVCSDQEEHKRRIETRMSNIERLAQPTWKEVHTREYEPWIQAKYVVDSAGESPEKTV